MVPGSPGWGRGWLRGGGGPRSHGRRRPSRHHRLRRHSTLRPRARHDATVSGAYHTWVLADVLAVAHEVTLDAPGPPPGRAADDLNMSRPLVAHMLRALAPADLESRSRKLLPLKSDE